MKYLKCAIFIVLAILLQRFCHKQTDGFALRKILSELSFNPAWEVTALQANESIAIKKALNQPYRYLSKGAQSYVFASEDGLYVLKFFRHDHMRAELWHCLLTKEHRKERFALGRSKLEKDFTSYKIAYETLQEETGLVYLHLNKTDNLHIKIPLYDKMGIQHTIDLDRMEFFLQKKVDPFFPSLEKWIKEDNLLAAQQALTELVCLLKRRFIKNIYDKDPDLNTNFGFLKGHPIQLDAGRFKHDPFYSNAEVYQREILRITDNLKQWLDTHNEELSLHLQKELNNL
ncbi:MAG: hypothetical protein V4494_03560 [Chlamydiota bacterium]